MLRDPGRLALAPVADWLRNPAVRSAVATIDPAWRTEVARLVPAEGRGGRGTGSRTMVDAWQRHRFFEGLARALLAVGRPTLLVLDNMQWCDQETLTFITFCLGLADGAQLLVAATLRNDDLDDDPELMGWTVRMRATGLLTELSSRPWTPPTRRISRRRFPGSPSPRPTRTCCTPQREVSRCTSSRRYVAPSIRAGRRCRPAISPLCCVSDSSR